MKGVITMKVTHDEICQAVFKWLNKELNYGHIYTGDKYNNTPFIKKITQSKDRKTFLLELSETKS